MYIDELCTQFNANPLIGIPQQLRVMPTLARILFLHRDKAEAEGIEYGRNLFFESGQIVSGETIQGQQTSVSLDWQQDSRLPEYVGDFHIHPYERKMSGTTSIGFSTDDIASYMRKRSGAKPNLLRFHMVVAGPKLWLIVLYPWTTQEPEADPSFRGDVETSMEFLGYEGPRYDRWHSGIVEMSEAVALEDKIAAERRMWDAIPGYPAVFAKASKAMNGRLARMYKYDLYTGKFGDRDATTLADLLLIRKASGL